MLLCYFEWFQNCQVVAGWLLAFSTTLSLPNLTLPLLSLPILYWVAKWLPSGCRLVAKWLSFGCQVFCCYAISNGSKTSECLEANKTAYKCFQITLSSRKKQVFSLEIASFFGYFSLLDTYRINSRSQKPIQSVGALRLRAIFFLEKVKKKKHLTMSLKFVII